MLQKIKIQPGFNKQVTATGGEGQWVSGDYVRFRYGTPEKIGGWAQLGDATLTGRNTALHHFVNSSGIKYAALGTNRFLYIYSGGAFYDITPIKSTNTLTNAFTTTQSDATVTITFGSAHSISKYDIIRLDNWSTITNSDFGASDFNDKNFMVATVPTSTTITIEMGSNESGSGASTSGGVRVKHFYSIGPATEESAAGWGLGLWGGNVAGEAFSTLDGALTDASTSIILDDSSAFPATGTVLIDDERIAYTSNTTGTGTLSGLTRGSDNTTAASHSDAATTYDASDYTKWGASQTVLIVTHDQHMAEAVDRYIEIRDGKTSHEAVRKSDELLSETHEHYALLDSAGRVQIPPDLIESHGIRRRVKLVEEEGRIVIYPPQSTDPIPGNQ